MKDLWITTIKAIVAACVIYTYPTAICRVEAASQWPPSDHCDGGQFYNDVPDHSFSDMVKWLWEMETVKWPKWVDDPVQPATLAHVNGEAIRVTFINHATVLIQTNGLNILTDPIYSMRAGPVPWLGIKRVRNPGVRFEDLPAIDIVLLSHDHYDHTDIPTLKRIVSRDKPVIIAGLGMKGFLEKNGIKRVYELDWWQSYTISAKGVTSTFTPALHDSGRAGSHNQTLWGGFVIESPSGRIYYAGDTSYGSFLNRISARYPDFRLTVFPVGSYEKRWFMINQHMNPDDAVRAHILLKSKMSIGMHYATFAEHPEQAIDAHEQDLKRALKKYNVSEREFMILKFGEGLNVP